MEISFLIVTKNRPEELQFSLQKLQGIFNAAQHEVLVFIDGCGQTEKLIPKYSWVQWEISPVSIGASPARAILYKKAIGTILVGLDDDAHPISGNFIAQVQNSFAQNPSVGIVTFQEIKGVFLSDEEALQKKQAQKMQYFTNDFIGCGFAITNAAYKKTRGFPVWIDIYGEEPCLAIEVIESGLDILYNNEIIVNHRVDRNKRLGQGRNYFRFEKQLKNTIFYYLVYYPKPTFSIIRLLVHNFKKYALTDRKCFVLFFSGILNAAKGFFKVLKYREPVSAKTLQKMKALKSIQY